MTTVHRPGATAPLSEFAQKLIDNDPTTTDPRAAAREGTDAESPGYETTDEDDQRFDAG